MTDTTNSSGFSLRRFVLLLVIAVVAIGGGYFLRDFLSFETLRDNREMLISWRDSNYTLVALAFIGIYIVVVAFSLPGAAIMTLSGGFLFGIFPGALFCVLGASIGAVLIFTAAKTGLGDMLHAKMHAQGGGGIMERMEKGLHENEVSYLLLMRLVPAIPFFIANLAPAFLGVKARNFTLTTFFGIMPGSIVYTSVGAGLGDVFAAGETPDFGIIFQPGILGPILGLCVLATLPIIIKAFTSKKETSQ
ncbi:MAG: VTT domain-containing protein [Rhodobacteraceae bacterium]|nr:VTT domain-containing protein [Paracoccaceae bacterium]